MLIKSKGFLTKRLPSPSSLKPSQPTVTAVPASQRGRARSFASRCEPTKIKRENFPLLSGSSLHYSGASGVDTLVPRASSVEGVAVEKGGDALPTEPSTPTVELWQAADAVCFDGGLDALHGAAWS